uniref:Uncharacterized protein n=1 Tax=Arundo donax TaxID=35708 RepID=A0A0A9C2B5_ARUDO
MATLSPFFSFPKYTLPKEPCPSLFPWQKFLVAFLSSLDE